MAKSSPKSSTPVVAAPLPAGVVSPPAKPKPNFPPTQASDNGVGARHDAAARVQAAIAARKQPAHVASPAIASNVAANVAKLAAAQAKGLTAASGPTDGRPTPRQALREDTASGTVSVRPQAVATQTYGATYAPASSFDVAPSYNTPGEMWVTVTNTGNFTWAANTIFMGYHLYKSDGTIYNYNGLSTEITGAVPPGGYWNLYSSFQFLPAGTYELVWDLRTGSNWFSDFGVPASQAIQFTVPHYAPTGIVDQPAYGATLSTTTPLLQLNVQADGTVQNQVYYEVCTTSDNTTGTCWNSGWMNVAWSTGSFFAITTWNPPANTLSWNTTYYWHARVKDPTFTTPWSQMSPFTPVVIPAAGAHYSTGTGSSDQMGVDLFLGNYSRRETDTSMQVPGFSLTFTRTYNSSNPTRGAFGVGWSSILDMHRTVASNGIVTVTYPDGRQVSYGRDPNGTYVPGYGESSQGQLVTTDLLVMGGVQYYFDHTSGALSQIQPPLAYTTDGTNKTATPIVFQLDTSGRVHQIVAVVNGNDSRYLTVNWTTDGYVQSITPASQPSLNYTYISGQLTKVCDQRTDLASCTQYSYTGTQLTGITRPNGGAETTRLAYWPDGTVESITVPGEDSSHSTWQYSQNTSPPDQNAAKVEIVTDPRGSSMSYEYDQYGSLWARWIGGAAPVASTERTWTYGPYGQVAGLYDENGNTTEYLWDPEGWLHTEIRVRDAQTSVYTNYQHDIIENGVALSASDPRYGQVTQVVDPDGSTLNMTYNTAGNIATKSVAPTFTAANTATTSYAYTCDGGALPPRVVNDPTVSVTTFQPCGLLLSVTDPDGHVTKYGYDHLGRQTQVTTPTGLVTNVFYDVWGHMGKKVIASPANPAGAETDYVYDIDGHLLTETDPPVLNQITNVTHQLKTTNTYDADGNLLTSVRSDTTPAASGGDASRSSVYTYDGLGNRTSTKLNGVTTGTAGYDALNELIRESDGNGTTYAHGYNQLGEPTYVQLINFVDDPTVPTTPRSIILSDNYYDNAGRLQSTEDAMQQYVTYKYTYDDIKSSETFLNYQDYVGGPQRDLVLHSYTYDPAGNLTKDTSGDGARVVTYGYNDANLKTSAVVDPTGVDRSTNYVYDPAGQLQSTTLSDGTRQEITKNAYASTGQLTQISVHNDATADLVTTYQRDAAGRVLGLTDPPGSAAFGSTASPNAAFTAVSSYDALGRLVSQADPAVPVEDGSGSAATTVSPTSSRGYDTFSDITDLRDPNGNVTHTKYDAFGRKTETDYPTAVEPNGSHVSPVEKWTHDNNGNVLTHIDKLGQTTSYTYDMRNRQIRVTQPSAGSGIAAGVTKIVYDDANNVLSTIDPTGAQTLHTYDVMERLSTDVQIVRNGANPSSQFTTTYNYDPFGELVAVAFPYSSISGSYDNAGELISSAESGHANATKYQYDVAGRLAKATDPMGQYTQYTYDLAGRRTKTAQYSSAGALLASTSYTYDTAGNLVSVLDPLNHTWTASYDADNRLTGVTDPAPNASSQTLKTTTGYDAFGHVTRITDANSNSTYNTYDALGNEITRVEPATSAQPNLADRTWTSNYNAQGEALSTTQPGGVTTTSVYDNLGRLTSQTGAGADGFTYPRQFGYDLDGHVTSISSPNLSPELFSYDDRGLLIAQTNAYLDGAISFINKYDDQGRLTSRTDGSGGTTSYTYSGINNIATESDTMTGDLRTYAYNDDNRVTSEKDAIGATAGPSYSYSYDGLGHVTSELSYNPAGAGTGSLNYTWDADNNLASKNGAGTFAAEGSYAYSYDNDNRLVSATSYSGSTKTGQESYTWDAVGNRLGVTDSNAGGVTTSSTTATYDQRDRLLSVTAPGSTTTYTWSSRGTLTSSAKTVTATGATTTTNNKFDAFNRLVQDGTTNYQYDALDRLENNGNGVNLSQYAPGSMEPATDGLSNYVRQPGPDSPPLASKTIANGNVQSLLHDAHGDVVAGVNPATGAIGSSNTYSPFGAITATSGSMPATGFQGSYTNSTTGLVYAQSRWYDPTTGTFLSEDNAPPNINTAVGGNLYAYAGANPVSALDPTGHDWWNPVDVIDSVGNDLNSFVDSVGGDVGGYVNDFADMVAQSWSEIASWGSDVVGAATDVIEAAAPVLEEVGVVAAEAAGETVACIIGCAELIVGGLIVVTIGAIAYEMIVNADGSTSYEGDYNVDTGPDTTTTTGTPTSADPGVGTGTPPPPPITPVPPVAKPVTVTGTSTKTSSTSWTTTSKWYDDTYTYTRVDHYTTTTTTITTYFSDGSYKWVTTTNTTDDWTITKQLLIDLSNPVIFTTPKVGSATAPNSDQGVATTSGGCGSGGSVVACATGAGKPAPPNALSAIAGGGGDGGSSNTTTAVGNCDIQPGTPKDANGKWQSNDAFVGRLANMIDGMYPGHVLAVNQKILNPDGTPFTEFDIETQNAIIEVKWNDKGTEFKGTAKGSGVADQVAKQMKCTDKPVIAFAPKMNNMIMQNVQNVGGLATNSLWDLLNVIAP